LSESEKIPSHRLVRTFGRLKGRALSRNQKLGLKIFSEKYKFNVETKKKKIMVGSWIWEWAALSRVSEKKS
jgi:hypothetical protein